MDDVSEFFKNGLRNLHKNKFGKNYHQRTLNQRLNNFNDMRRETRNTLMFQKRQIKENMTPIGSPEHSRVVEQTTKKETKPNKRLELLQKWKLEKEKQKQEKKKVKPPFKVSHVSVEVGLPDLENVNKTIKGKAIKSNTPQSRSQFAPPNHKFRPPKNIEPISIPSKNTTQIKPVAVHKLNHTNTNKMHEKTLNKNEVKKLNKPLRNIVEQKSVPVNTKRSPIKLRSTRRIVSSKNKDEYVLTVPSNTKGKGLSNVKITSTNNKTNESSKSEASNVIKRNDKPLKKPLKSQMKITWDVSEIENDEINTIPKVFKKTPRKERKSSRSREIDGFDSPVTPKNMKMSNTPKKSSTKKKVQQIEQHSIIECTPSSDPHTPLKRPIEDEPCVYISPFVTVSRGKSSARKEYRARRSSNVASDYDLDLNILSNTSPKVGADYFTKKLNNEIIRIEELCQTWDDYKNSTEIPEEAIDMIDVAIGQSRLLISKKFQQFRNLIEECRTCEFVEKPITCEDLHGFWDMIYMQVEDLDKRFNNLNTLKGNSWQEVVPEKKISVKQRKGRPKKAAASAALKNLIKAARNNKKTLDDDNSKAVECETGYLSIKSPFKDLNETVVKDTSTRRSLRVSLLSNQSSMSPGLTMMKISQSIKHGNGVTPSKSILKSDGTRSAKKLTKSVLFKENLVEDSENNIPSTEDCNNTKENEMNEINLSGFIPVTPIRRSERLRKVSVN